MKNIFRFASLLASAVMLFASCEGTGTGTGTGTGGDDITPGGSTTKGELTLDVDNLIIQAGVDQAKLTVKLDGKEISEGVMIFGNDNNVVDLGADFIFTSETPGTYSFWANYQTFNSNTVTVTVVNTPVPATPEDPQPSSTSFVRRVLLTKFTGAQCQFCPTATASIHKFFDEHELAPYVVKTEAHTFSADDPAYFDGPFYGVQNFPSLSVDWHTITTSVDYTTLTKIVADRYEAEDAVAGISVNSVATDGAITFKVCVKAAKSGQYRVGAWLLEDNIKGTQKGAPVGEENAWYHTFNDCIRIADSKSGASYAGLKLGAIEAGKTAEMMFAWDLAKDYPKSEGWKKEDLKLCVFVSCPDEKGYSYIVNNVVTAPINGETKFEYK